MGSLNQALRETAALEADLKLANGEIRALMAERDHAREQLAEANAGYLRVCAERNGYRIALEGIEKDCDYLARDAANTALAAWRERAK